MDRAGKMAASSVRIAPPPEKPEKTEKPEKPV